MTKYLLIESHDSFDYSDTEGFVALAIDLARGGEQVSFFLIQNAVFPARRSARSGLLLALGSDGVELLVDEVSLMERGISPYRLIPGARIVPIDVIVDHLAAGSRVLWH